MYALRTAHYGPTEGLVDDEALPRMFIRPKLCLIRDFSICHDDFEKDPSDGVLKVHTFNWLGFAQYIHVTTGLPHHSKAPRVVLVHKQFVVGTAADMLHLPKNYKLFGVGNSLALIKLIRPLKSPVPRDFDSERLAKKTLKLYTHRECKQHRMKARLGSEGVTHVLCSSGCGVRPGATIISHSSDGPFELIGVAAGGAPCHRRSMRRRLNNEPPLYIDVFPYTNWIMNVITAHHLPKPYPQNFKLVDAGPGIPKIIPFFLF
ncbi:unnamed protein product [Spodoptera littoralis]|uniref:Peptidase S1 domain-containing protein n=1 Tax=Spodoptera littoralis TaxID=7109 RepID=A0A9P0I216_SPOLI|nr:unnamed protein product [Spodoptera littoralis]CAH1639775.1 unnamed protein product [Spodoptera littoralis]